LRAALPTLVVQEAPARKQATSKLNGKASRLGDHERPIPGARKGFRGDGGGEISRIIGPPHDHVSLFWAKGGKTTPCR